MASKLASIAANDEIFVSDRFFNMIQNDLVLKSCGCVLKPEGRIIGEKVYLWEEVDVQSYGIFDFSKAHKLKSHWCQVHGKQYCENILTLDDQA
jgi:hypothetical protein